MDFQRRSQRPGNKPRDRRGLAGLAPVFLTLALALGACEGGDPFTPAFVPPLDQDGATSGGGGGDDSTNAQLVVGIWEVTIVTPLMDDILTERTVWEFGADLNCQQTIYSTLGSEGSTRVTRNYCTYQVVNFDIVVLFDDTLQEVTFPFDFAAFDPDRLILDGFEYTRIG
ncbi:MAG TPA: hypothetical protein VFO06_12450 [Gemmatimonadales bacterium]|nr:hypothetical protein [Gemmatimonadales bacterium]